MCRSGLYLQGNRSQYYLIFSMLFNREGSGLYIKSTEHAGVRVMQYPDEVVIYPYLPGARRGSGYINESGEWVQVQREKNRAKVEAARSRRAEKVIRGSVKVLAKNSGVFFTVTTAGVPGRHPGKLPKLLDKMRKECGLLYYVWVRELTKSGLVHWHVAAVFTRRGMDWVRWIKANNRIIELSNWWAAQLGGQLSGNSIRLGWDVDKKTGRPRKYLLDFKAAGYLVKYLRKSQRQEKGARLWTTNLDFLRPVRFDVIKQKIYAAGGQIKQLLFEPDSESEAIYADYHLTPYIRLTEINRPPDVIPSKNEYWAKIWRVTVQYWNLRNMN